MEREFVKYFAPPLCHRLSSPEHVRTPLRPEISSMSCGTRQLFVPAQTAGSDHPDRLPRVIRPTSLSARDPAAKLGWFRVRKHEWKLSSLFSALAPGLRRCCSPAMTSSSCGRVSGGAL